MKRCPSKYAGFEMLQNHIFSCQFYKKNKNLTGNTLDKRTQGSGLSSLFVILQNHSGVFTHSCYQFTSLLGRFEEKCGLPTFARAWAQNLEHVRSPCLPVACRTFANNQNYSNSLVVPIHSIRIIILKIIPNIPAVGAVGSFGQPQQQWHP